MSATIVLVRRRITRRSAPCPKIFCTHTGCKNYRKVTQLGVRLNHCVEHLDKSDDILTIDTIVQHIISQ